MLDQAIDLPRVASDQKWRQVTDDRRQPGGKEALAGAEKPIRVRLDPDAPRQVIVDPLGVTYTGGEMLIAAGDSSASTDH